MGCLSDDLDRFLMTYGKQIYHESMSTRRQKKPHQSPTRKTASATKSAKKTNISADKTSMSFGG